MKEDGELIGSAGLAVSRQQGDLSSPKDKGSMAIIQPFWRPQCRAWGYL